MDLSEDDTSDFLKRTHVLLFTATSTHVLLINSSIFGFDSITSSINNLGMELKNLCTHNGDQPIQQ